MPFGYNGRILHVDLSNEECDIENPPETFYRKYFGGEGIGMYYILKEMPAHADPLGPENILALTLSVVTGLPISGQSRVMANAKSPLTNTIGDAQAGGFWPAEAKRAGFDAFIIKGKSKRPVYLWVHDGEAEIRDASHLWGKDTGETAKALRKELGEKIHVLGIGPAGENLVRYACLINNANRANGRTGMGAVMGSKNLKAVAVSGSSKLTLADKESFQELVQWGAKNLSESGVAGLREYGTAGLLSFQQAAGGLPTRNWQSGAFDDYEQLDGVKMKSTIFKESDTCFACVVRCKQVVEIKDGPYIVDPLYGGPEYETLAALGSYCCISDLSAVSKANQLCNMYGLDTISTGAVIAWAMDCFDKGILTLEDTGGIDLSFGNGKALVEMTEQIALREGFGDILAEGIEQASAKYGSKAEELTISVKGNPLPAHMPEVKRSLALIYAVNPHGADHMSHEHDPSYNGYPDRMAEIGLLSPQPNSVLNTEKVRYALYTQYFYTLLNTLGLCQFVWGPGWQLYGPSQIVEMVRAVTGWKISLWELMKAGERSLNMMRAFNSREGFSRKEDKLPPKLFQPLVGGASDGVAVDYEELEKAISTYYAMAGWDENGCPTRAKLEELDTSWVADLLGV